MITPAGASSFQAQDKRLHIGEEKRGGQGEIGLHIGDVETDAHGSAPGFSSAAAGNRQQQQTDAKLNQ